MCRVIISELTEHIQTAVPVTPPPPPEPTLLCVHGFFFKLIKGDGRFGPIALCDGCHRDLPPIQRSWYHNRHTHFLLVARGRVNFKCHRCNTLIVIIHPPNECDRCRTTLSQLLGTLQRRGQGLDILDDVVRIPHYRIPRTLSEILPYLAVRQS